MQYSSIKYVTTYHKCNYTHQNTGMHLLNVHTYIKPNLHLY